MNCLIYVIQAQNFFCMPMKKIYKQIFNRQDRDNLLCDLTKLNSWADNWLLKLNIVKCKKVSFGRHIEGTELYSIDNVELENV